MALTLTQIETSKEILIDLYWKREKTLIEVGKILSCSLRKVNYFMEKYKISRRKVGPIKKENKKLFCKTKDCDKEVTKGSKSGYCKSCAMKKRFEDLLELQKLSIAQKNRIHKDDCNCVVCMSKNDKYKGINNPNYTTGITLQKHYCIDCLEKDIFTEITCQAERCVDCVRRIFSENNSGKNHYNYIDGRSYESYSKEFNSKLKEKIRKRDNYTCQKCDIIEKKHKLLFKQSLHIHHIDFDKKNNNLDNLITLCCKCNSIVNFNRGYWEEYFKEKIKNVFNFN